MAKQRSSALGPTIGDALQFRHPNSQRFRHKFYDDFPNGRQVPASASSVDLTTPITIDEMSEAIIGRAVYRAVRFTNPADGVQLWTNYSRDNHMWLVPVRAVRAVRGPY